MGGLQASADPAGGSFDYAEMDAGTASEARAAVERYRARSKAYFMDTGRDLLAVKDQLEHGLFLRWVQSEMGMNPRTAQNFMQAAAHLGHKSEIVSHLPATAIYQLAAPSTPEPVRAEVMRRLEAGERLEGAAVVGLVQAAKTEARRKEIEAREDARLAGLTEEQRATEQKQKLSRAKRKALKDEQAARERAEWAARQAAEAASADKAAALLAERMGPDLERFLSLVHSSGFANNVIQRADTILRLQKLGVAEMADA